MVTLYEQDLVMNKVMVDLGKGAAVSQGEDMVPLEVMSQFAEANMRAEEEGTDAVIEPWSIKLYAKARLLSLPKAQLKRERQ